MSKELTMTWKAIHNRGETLRLVIATSAERRDGIEKLARNTRPGAPAIDIVDEEPRRPFIERLRAAIAA